MRISYGLALARVALAVLFASQSWSASPDTAAAAPESTRQLDFSVATATWVSVDVSPDGATLLFDVLGEVYSLPMAGGTAKQLTTDTAFNGQPRFSPDGKHIAYISDRSGTDNVWIMDVDGTHAREISHDQQQRFVSPTWLGPNEIGVSRRGMSVYGSSFELWLYDIRGGSGTALVRRASSADARRDTWKNALGATSGSDSRNIYFAAVTGDVPGAVPIITTHLVGWQIHRLDRLTGEESAITAVRTGALRPEVSHDGSRIAYGTRHGAFTELHIRDLRDGGDHMVLSHVDRDAQEGAVPTSLDLLPGYAFTPDDRFLVIAYDGQLHRVNLANGVVEVIPMRIPVHRQIMLSVVAQNKIDTGPVVNRIIQHPVASKEGTLAFGAFGHIYVSDAHGEHIRRLTRDTRMDAQPTWSPDGRWLAYVTWSAQTGGAIWKMRGDGKGSPQQLTNDGAYYRDPAWSADATRLVALRRSRDDARQERSDLFINSSDVLAEEAPIEPGDRKATVGPDLVWIPAAGGETHVITATRGGERPQLLRSSDRIYLTSGASLTSFRQDGSDFRTHLQVTDRGSYDEGHDWHPQIVLDPTGHYALAKFRRDCVLFAVPSTGAPLEVSLSSPAVPLWRVSSAGADEVTWSDDGKTVIWSLGPVLFQRKLSDVIAHPAPANDTNTSWVDSLRDGLSPQQAAALLEPEAQATSLAVTLPRAGGEGRLILRGARVVTMRGDEIVPAADVTINADRIVSVEEARRGAAAAPATVLDVRGMTITPGFVDLHPHWIELRRGVLDFDAWSLANYLAYGVTTGRDPNGVSPDIFVYQDLVDAGEIPGVRAFTTGPAIYHAVGPSSAADALAIIARFRLFYRTTTVKSYLVGTRQQQQWMVAASRQLNMMPTTEGGWDLRLDLTHIMDGMSGNEHMLPVAPLYDDVIKLMAASGIFYDPVLLETGGGPSGYNVFYQDPSVVNDPKVRLFYPPSVLDGIRRTIWVHPEDQFVPALARSSAAVVHAGGNVVVGSHGNFAGLGYHWNLWRLAEGGLTPLEALRAATIKGAAGIGLSQSVGSLEPGKLADLLVFDKNPLDDIHNTTSLRYVIKAGIVYDAATLDEVWPKRQPRPVLWWQGRAPGAH